jgi:hypothetical protein
VLNKCANPACAVAFRKLHQGKLFLVETEPLVVLDRRREHLRGQPSHRVEYYWLCDQCAMALTLSYDKAHGVIVIADSRPEMAKKRPVTPAPPRELPSKRGSSTEQSA